MSKEVVDDVAAKLAAHILENYTVGYFSTFCEESEYDSLSQEELAEMIRGFFIELEKGSTKADSLR